MEIVRFTEAEIKDRAHSALAYFVARPRAAFYQIPTAVKIDLAEQSTTRRGAWTEETPWVTIDVIRPSVMTSGGLSEAVKGMAAYWNIFNQIFERQCSITGDE